MQTLIELLKRILGPICNAQTSLVGKAAGFPHPAAMLVVSVKLSNMISGFEYIFFIKTRPSLSEPTIGEFLENILKDNNKVPKHGSGVGLINVHNRIQLMFGNEYGLLVYSEPDEGTKIVIHIPAIPFTEENRQQLEAQSYRNGRATDETR